MPERIQRKRTKGWKMPPNTVYVGRPTKWGNDYIVGEYSHHTKDIITPEMAVKLYRDRQIPLRSGLEDLRGKNLACWCPLDKPCHVDVLLEIANQ